MPRPALLPFVIAAVMTGLNAAKPAVVDDAAYLAMADHISRRPLDPYGFEQFWYRAPEPAMQVLAPPVVPYTLAAGLALFGDELPLVKLTLFPFCWLFTAAGHALLLRFARGTERAGVCLLGLSPAALPMVNAMLDVPAAALGLAAVAVFARGCDRGCDRGSVRLAAAAGLLAGLAVQAKYSALSIPAVLVLYGLVYRRLGLTAVAVGAAVAAVVGWELLLVWKYGASHFLVHAAAESGGTAADRLREKWSFVGPLVVYWGTLSVGWGVFAVRAAGAPGWAAGAAAAAFSVGMAAVVAGPADWVTGPRPADGYPRVVEAKWLGRAAAAGVAVPVAAAVARLLARRPSRAARTWFLVAWFAVEAVATVGLTPFPAGRRVVMLSAVTGLLAAHAVSRLGRADPRRRPPRWAAAWGCGWGVALAGLDTWDAFPEKAVADRAAAVVAGAGGGTVWTQGHWGWQYYAGRNGFRPVVAGVSRLEPGDWLVLPVVPNVPGFFRPLFDPAATDPAAIDRVAEVWWDDPVPYQTLPTLYGGTAPVLGRDFPRLKVRIFRVVRSVTPTY